MNYTHNVTSKGQITIPKDFREKLGLDKLGKATMTLNDRNEIILSVPKTLEDVRKMLKTPDRTDPLSEKEKIIGDYLVKKYDTR